MAVRADAVYNGLSSEQQTITPRIFLRLIAFGEGRPDTRRRQPVSALRDVSPDPALFRQTLDMLAAPAIPPTCGFYDECLKGEVQFSLGFMKPSPVWRFGSPSSFGSPGAGGAMGFADPSAGIGYAYVTSQSGAQLTGDPRDVRLRDALYSAIGHSLRTHRVA